MAAPSCPAEQPSPRTVGNTFMRQYYHFLAKEPQSLHRFYKSESRWCHGVGSHMEEPIAGQRAINDEILKRGYAGARVELDAGSIDCQQSLGGGVLVLVTGVMTLHRAQGVAKRSPVAKPFVQTFFLAVQPKGFFVLNDCLRFLELPRDASGLDEEGLETRVEGGGAGEKKQVEGKDEMREQETETDGMEQEEEVDAAAAAAAAAGAQEEEVATSVETEVVAEDTAAALPLSSLTSSSSSAAVEKTTIVTTTTTTERKDDDGGDAVPATAAAVETLSPVKSVKQEGNAIAAAAAAPADPVVPVPAEPEKPKTWAALFSASTSAAAVASSPAAAVAATVPQAVAPVMTVVTKDVAPSTASGAPAATSPSPSGAAPERSPKHKASKEKEPKRLYSLFIRDLPPQMRDSDLRDLFKGYGSIAGVNVVAQRNFAFVDYYEQESMRAALAETKEFKVLDKVLQVSERGDRKDGPRSGFRSNDSRGRGRGYGGPKSGRGDRKERSGDDAPSFSKGERREGPRREKTGNRRGGKVEAATSHNRAE